MTQNVVVVLVLVQAQALAVALVQVPAVVQVQGLQMVPVQVSAGVQVQALVVAQVRVLTVLKTPAQITDLLLSKLSKLSLGSLQGFWLYSGDVSGFAAEIRGFARVWTNLEWTERLANAIDWIFNRRCGQAFGWNHVCSAH